MIFVLIFYFNTLKVVLQYIFNVLLLFNTVSYIKLNLKLKIDPKVCIFKNLEKFLKNGMASLY